MSPAGSTLTVNLGHYSSPVRVSHHLATLPARFGCLLLSRSSLIVEPPNLQQSNLHPLVVPTVFICIPSSEQTTLGTHRRPKLRAHTGSPSPKGWLYAYRQNQPGIRCSSQITALMSASYILLRFCSSETSTIVGKCLQAWFQGCEG